jgi:3-deoxy-D-manno-octulosonic-acid transferase
MSFVYNLFIQFYQILIRFATLLNPKAKLWVDGRKGLLRKLAGQIDKDDKIAWFHAASLGEFEQGRPVIETFRKRFSDYKILLTFFSPSGYEIRKNYDGADYIIYLPIDTKRNTREFIKIVQPKLVVFIKYEFWFNYLKVLSENNIPVFFASVIFRKEQHFFKWYGSWPRKMLKKVSFFFVQNRTSFDLLKSIGINQVEISGDTRFDRVFSIAENTKKFPLIEKFAEGKKVFLAGSTWSKDEELIEKLSTHNPALKIIIAPHEIHQERIDSVIQRFASNKTLKYSEASDENISTAQILIIDGMGFLSGLYQYCHFAYIGGGFGKGIHNILEAATFGKPVIFGPNFQRFAEAVELVHKEGAFVINNISELIAITEKLLQDDVAWQSASFVCKEYVKTKKGATELILSKISEFTC